jgi:hypothetical protein
MVHEPDVVWSFESLLREVTDELSNTPKMVVSSTTSAPPAAPTAPAETGNATNATLGKSGPMLNSSSKPNAANNAILSPAGSKIRNDKKRA